MEGNRLDTGPAPKGDGRRRFFGVTGIAGADPFVDYKCINEWYSGVESHTYLFNLDEDNLLIGDINSGDKVESATLLMSFYDDFDTRKEFAEFNLDGTTSTTQIFFGWKAFNVLTQVTSDHLLTVIVSNAYLPNTTTYGDFGLFDMSVDGCYSAAVPEPATLLFLGSGLLGLGLFSRRKFKK